jgi:DNA-binding MarR family transcriptional regulator
MTPTELSKGVFRSKHAITRAVDSLEKEGLVAREGIGTDRRTRRVAITKEGLDVIKQAMPYRQEVSSTAMSCLSEQQAQEFNAALRQLRKHILKLIDHSTGQGGEQL